MILSNLDLYATVKAISEELQRAGEEQWSAALNDALSISTVPGEVLGEMRLQLQRLRLSEASVRLDLRWQIDEALSYLDEILRPSP